MHIQTESPAATDTRLSRVLRDSDVHSLPGEWRFAEFAHADFATSLHPEALALIRDGNRWRQLVPADLATVERLTLLVHPLRARHRHSGFVGWLATLISSTPAAASSSSAARTPSVAARFDYWCAPSPRGAIHSRPLRGSSFFVTA